MRGGVLVVVGLLVVLSGCLEPATDDPVGGEGATSAADDVGLGAAVRAAHPNQTWSGPLSPILYDTSLMIFGWGYPGPDGPKEFMDAQIYAEDGALLCTWTVDEARVPAAAEYWLAAYNKTSVGVDGYAVSCAVEDMAFALSTVANGSAVLLDGAPLDPEGFTTTLGFWVLNATHDAILAASWNTTFPAPYLEPPTIGNTVGCDTADAIESLPTGGVPFQGGPYWSTHGVGGRVDATWTAPYAVVGYWGGGGSGSTLTLLDNGVRAHINFEPYAAPGQLVSGEVSMILDVQVEETVSQAPSDEDPCRNVVHGETVTLPLTATWTPWHGEPVDISQDVEFQAWLEMQPFGP